MTVEHNVLECMQAQNGWGGGGGGAALKATNKGRNIRITGPKRMKREILSGGIQLPCRLSEVMEP